MNWPVLIVFGMAALALLIFLVRKNMKDEKEFEKQIKEDYPKSKDEEGDVEIDELTK